MIRYVAFLRGINLGNRRLKMDELRRHFEALDVVDPRTYLASGNVVFDLARRESRSEGPSAPGRGFGPGGPDRYDSGAAKVEERIEEHLAAALGYEVDTFVRSLDALSGLVGEVAEVVTDPAVKPHVIFLRGPVGSEAEEALRALETPEDRFRVLDREVAWLRRGRLSDSAIETRHLEKAFGGRSSTMRTLDTVRRIVKKFEDPG